MLTLINSHLSNSGKHLYIYKHTIDQSNEANSSSHGLCNHCSSMIIAPKHHKLPRTKTLGLSAYTQFIFRSLNGSRHTGVRITNLGLRPPLPVHAKFVLTGLKSGMAFYFTSSTAFRNAYMPLACYAMKKIWGLG